MHEIRCMHEIGKAVIVTAMLISPDARSLGQERFGAIDDEGNRDTLPNKYNIRLIRQEAAALQTATFYFERPTEFQFTAGQFIEMTISSVELSESAGIHNVLDLQRAV